MPCLKELSFSLDCNGIIHKCFFLSGVYHTIEFDDKLHDGEVKIINGHCGTVVSELQMGVSKLQMGYLNYGWEYLNYVWDI